MWSLLETIENIKKRPNFEKIKGVVQKNLKSFMIGDSYPNHYYLQVTKTAASWVLNYMEVFLRSKDVTQGQVFDVLMSFDVTSLDNAQLLMDYIWAYETRDDKDFLLVLDTQKLFNKLRTEMPIEYRENRAIWLPLQELQEKGLDFKW